jgi:hypothetical protein
MNNRQKCIDVYSKKYLFDLKLMDEWSFIYTDPELFWQAQYARYYAKEMFDIAVALDKDDIESKDAWPIADASEAVAKILENCLIPVQAATLKY